MVKYRHRALLQKMRLFCHRALLQKIRLFCHRALLQKTRPSNRSHSIVSSFVTVYSNFYGVATTSRLLQIIGLFC